MAHNRIPSYLRNRNSKKKVREPKKVAEPKTPRIKEYSVEQAYDNAVAALQFLSTAIYTENAKDVDNMEEVNNMITVLTVLLSDYFKVEEV